MKQVLFFFSLFLAAACGEKNPAAQDSTPAAPSQLSVERVGRTSVRLSWKDNSDNETGFALYLRPSDNLSQTECIGRTAPDVTSALIEEGLREDHSYYFGVQALGSDEEHASRVEYTLYNLVSLAHVPVLEIASSRATDCSFVLQYRLSNYEKLSGMQYGLCWSADGTPSLQGLHQTGPVMTTAGETLLQVIPDATLETGKDYQVAVYVTSSTGTWYSEPVTLRLQDAPAPIVLEWKELDAFDGVSVYETTTTVSGRKFHAWYATADPARVDFRVHVPASAATIDAQRNALGEKCLVLTNGGYFYDGRHTGLSIQGGVPGGSISPVRGSLRSGDSEYNVLYNVTRGLFGTDANGKPAVWWAGYGADGKQHYYRSPLPSVRGEAPYGEVSGSQPCQPVQWTGAEALSAGPVLLYEGRIPFNFEETAKGAEYYLNNFEIMPYDIFGADVICDRTAAAFTAEGKILLFICDGRISESPGLNLLELARILKGLGCTHAVNFDGGGSTGMMVKNTHINDITPNNRPVVSTMGFFKK